MPDKKEHRKKLPKMQKNLTRKQFSPEITTSERVPKCIKSFSHELGPKGGTQSVHPRVHSFNDLEVLNFFMFSGLGILCMCLIRFT